jgi:hypothetical protein
MKTLLSRGDRARKSLRRPARLGQSLTWDDASERITGDEQASAMHG